jgi:hypothetical protein
VSEGELKKAEEARARAAEAVIESTSPKRLVVSGPGTGKSFAFKKSLAKVIAEAGEGQGLALTFIKKLVPALQKDVGPLARVDTFHGYSKQLMHQHVAGLHKADLYPLLLDLLVEDLGITKHHETNKASIEEHLQTLDVSDGLVHDLMEIADYYGAVSFPDLVFRVYEHFRGNEGSIPTWPLVVVDEYQDFSLLETSFIDLLAKKSPVLIAGDDDQAVYAGFRYASPEFIRNLARGGDYETHELPYCSRCTSVVVAAVKDVIARAKAKGYLADRLDKRFECYLPAKQAASDANPRIIDVECSTFMQPYAGYYIVQQIERIPAEDIVESRKNEEPTVLVIGPKPFLTAAFDVVSKRFPHARMKVSESFRVDLLDGYERIAKNENSRLGWRIVMHCDPPKKSEEIIKQALEEQSELAALLPSQYVDDHKAVAGLLGALIRDGNLSEQEEKQLCAALGKSIEEIRGHLKLVDEAVDEERDVEVIADRTANAEVEPEDDRATIEPPEILFTSAVGSKGLSAQHVFIVGLNSGHFPRVMSDEEICTFLVALSRTRKRCHLVSYKWFTRSALERSEFLEWIEPHLEHVTVNKDYDFTT